MPKPKPKTTAAVTVVVVVHYRHRQARYEMSETEMFGNLTHFRRDEKTYGLNISNANAWNFLT